MPILGPYDVGDSVRVGNHSTGDGTAFTNTAGTATDPTEVTLRLKKPDDDGTIVTYRWPTPGAGESALTRETTGRFYADYTWDVAGLWSVELQGTGTIESMAQWQLWVNERLVQ